MGEKRFLVAVEDPTGETFTLNRYVKSFDEVVGIINDFIITDINPNEYDDGVIMDNCDCWEAELSMRRLARSTERDEWLFSLIPLPDESNTDKWIVWRPE
jgi:hypothetical protein